MDATRRIALYARVSSHQQTTDATIQSQVAALKKRIADDRFQLDPELVFQDDGHSGATLQRPALERLRDLVYAGGIDRLYIHSPDRLARKLVHQALLLEEFAKRHVEVAFLNQPTTNTAEDNLLLNMQGIIAEYEREKILERTRRGRRYSAQQGRISVLCRAPYGYRYVCKQDGDGEARYDLVLNEVRVVRDLFRWVAIEGLSLGDAARRLTKQNAPTRKGARCWSRNTVRRILRNPAYYGEAHWGKTRQAERSPNQRPSRGHPEAPRREKVSRPTQPSEQEIIRVPALIGRDLFDAAAERLDENRRRQRTRLNGPSFLLSGLLVCDGCGSAYIGRRHHSRSGRAHTYYRCIGTEKRRHGGEALCSNRAAPEALDEQVWKDACELLRDPKRIHAELQRRQQTTPTADKAEAESLRRSIAGLKRQLSRLTDMYENGYLDKDEFADRAQRVKVRLERERKAFDDQRQASQQSRENSEMLADFEGFAQDIRAKIDKADFKTKRTILSLLIKKIKLGVDTTHIVYKVDTRPFARSPEKGSLPHCNRRLCAAERVSW